MQLDILRELESRMAKGDPDAISWLSGYGAELVLLWPLRDFQMGQYVPLALGLGVGYYMLGGQLTGQPPMELAKAYLAAGGANLVYYYAMGPGPLLYPTTSK